MPFDRLENVRRLSDVFDDVIFTTSRRRRDQPGTSQLEYVKSDVSRILDWNYTRKRLTPLMRCVVDSPLTEVHGKSTACRMSGVGL